MGFDFSGHVLRAPRTATSNSQTTAESKNGVVRAVEAPSNYTLAAAAPALVDVRADQYRAAVLDAPGTSPVEYCVWAENSSNLALRNDASWAISEGTGTIPVGTKSVVDTLMAETYTTGTSTVLVNDDGSRTLGGISALVIARGDVTYDDEGWVDSTNFSLGRKGATPYLVVIPSSTDVNLITGAVKLDSLNLTFDGVVYLSAGGGTQILTDLDGGLTSLRGDRIVEVQYSLAAARFWWTRNDRYQSRFGWDGAVQRWVPYKGSPALDLGVLNFDETYLLSPRPQGLVVGANLPGDGATADAYSMIRAGTTPGAVASLPVGLGTPGFPVGVRVVSDRSVEGYDFGSTPTFAAVLGKTNGSLKFNPTFIEQHAGKHVWYVARDFGAEFDGVVGPLRDADKNPLYLSPIPAPTDFPLLSLGSRHYLSPTLVFTEGGFASLNLSEGEVAVAMSTGRVLLSQADVDKANPDKEGFDRHFLGEVLVYSGVALNGVPQPVKKETEITGVTVNGLTKHFVAGGTMLPQEWVANDPYRGLGVSGVVNVPDGTGVVPSNPAADVPIRPGGDNLTDINDGRIRQVSDSVSDAIVFSRAKALSVIVVDKEADIPPKIPAGTAYVCRENVNYGGSDRGSRVAWGRKDTREFGSDPVYFLQTDFLPATRTTAARLISKSRFIFRFPEPVILYFAVDGVGYQWTSATSLTDTSRGYTPDEVAADIATVILGSGTSYALNGSVVIEAGVVSTGSVEIGWGVGGVKDLSGAANLGFLPGWRAVGGVDNWLPDSGISFGMQRSPVNPNRVKEAPDFNAYSRLLDETLMESVPQAPFVFFNVPPLQDVAGYDEGVFFNLKTVVLGPDSVEILNKNLHHYTEIVHRFGEDKFLWVEQDTQTEMVQKATSTLGFGKANVIPESLRGAPGIGGGLFISEGGSFEVQDSDRDFLLPQDGATGVAQLIRRFGDSALFGGRGSVTAGSSLFTDPDTNFIAASDEQASDSFGDLLFDAQGDPLFLPIAQEGYRLKISSGPAKGSYTVTDVAINGTDLTLEPVPVVGTGRATPWELFRGFTPEVYDPSIIADQVYKTFNHLPDETFKVRVLSKLGTPPADQAASRLRASMEAALSRGRAIALRFGLAAATAANTASLALLSKTDLGHIANGVLVVPSSDDIRFLGGHFDLLVGTDRLPATLAANFSADPGAGSGIEVLQADGPDGEKGLIKFGSTLLTNYAEALVHVVDTFLNPTDLSAGVAECDPENGDLNLSSADVATFASETVWFVERMISEDALDVSLAPMSGTAGFQEPLKEFQAVEFEYQLADLEGRRSGVEKTTEFLSVFVRDEETSRTDDITFQYNLTGREMDLRLTPTVRVGAMIQNFGAVTDCVIEPPTEANGLGTIKFLNKRIPSHVKVLVAYASFEASGGERSYNASKSPIYRPPFYIAGEKDNFGLRTDRTGDFEVGQMLRIGESCHYIRRLQYFPDSDLTRVDIFPPTVNEVGSRAPGNDALNLITANPLTTEVDPDGGSPVAAGGSAGFMQPVPLDQCPFEPVEQGTKTITFLGDLTQFAVPGHILEVAGMPFTIAQATLSDDGTRTKITTTGIFQKGITVSSSPTVKLSYRPVYPPNVRVFLGANPVIDTEPLELVLFGEADSAGNELPGRTLIRDVEWGIDTGAGAVTLLEPVQQPLGPGQKLVLSFTKIRTLAPFLSQGIVAYPRYFSSFLFNTLPSADNGILGGLLSATFTYRDPDTFYCRATTLTSFLGEAVKTAVEDIKARQPAGGGISTAIPSMDNWEQGRQGLISQGRHLHDQDRAARTFLDFYNTAVVAFEQIPETISGGFVGDRDGKFRFFIGKGKAYPTPGYEDEISGRLADRFVWGDVFNAANPLVDMLVFPSDRVTHPFATTLTDGEVDGPPPNASLLRTLGAMQKPMIRNDVDDVVLLGSGRPDLRFISTPPYFLFRGGPAITQEMGGVHRMSRLFPTETKAFLITYPGIGADEAVGDPGVYARSRTLDGERQSTFRTEIGQLANPALGPLTNVTQASVYKRRARARIWGYFPEGIPAGAFEPTGPIPAVDITDPCVVAFPYPLGDVPMHPATGYPDVAKLLSDAGGLGDVPDLNSGDPDLALPGFLPGDQINWGKPDGTVYSGLTEDEITITIGALSFGKRLTALFVHDIQHGCIMRLQDKTGALISDPAKVLVGTSPGAGVVAGSFPITNGDTIYSVAASGGDSPFADPLNPTTEELMAAAASNDVYDVRWQPDGKLIDITLPSFSDPTWFGLKEILGQNPPPPLGAVEGDVQFSAVFQNPVQLPALKGEFTDDTGDNQIPYLRGANTELQRFAQVSVSLPAIVSDEYPEDIFAEAGEIVGAASIGDAWNGNALLPKEAAALTVVEDLFPKTTTPGLLGVADLRMYDLLLIETDDTEAAVRSGSQGILSVGSVERRQDGADTQSIIKQPRFVTPTTPPARWQVGLNDALVANASNVTGVITKYDLISYNTFLNVPAYTLVNPQGDLPIGVAFKEEDVTADGITDQTTIDFTNAGITLALNDGGPGVVGGLNDLWSDNPVDVTSNNTLTIAVFARTDPTAANGGAGQTHGQLLLQIILSKAAGVPSVEVVPAVGVGNGPINLAVGDVEFHEKHILIKKGGIFDWGPGAGLPNQWFIPHTDSGAGPGRVYESIYGFEFTFSLQVSAVGAGSETAWVDRDRLTFHEVVDMRGAMERGTLHPQEATTSLQTSLRVVEVETPAGAVDVNDVNGGAAFTFLRQSGAVAPFCGGTWSPKVAATSPEHGTLEVPSFEGDGNLPVLGANIRLAALPTWATDVFEGAGKCESKNNPSIPVAERDRYDDRVTSIANTVGSWSDIEKGDVLIVDRSDDLANWGSTKVGTWPIRYAVQALTDLDADLIPDVLEVSPAELLGPGGVMFSPFPIVRGMTATTLTANSTEGVSFSAVGRVYVILDASVFGDAAVALADFQKGLWSATYTGISMVGGQQVFSGLAGFLWADGTAPTAGEQSNLIAQSAGKRVSGFEAMSMSVQGASNGLPNDNSIVGWHDTAGLVKYVHGVRYINLTSPGGTARLWDASLGQVVDGAPAAGELGIDDTPALTEWVFFTDPTRPVYPHVPVALRLAGLATADWDGLNNPAGHGGAPDTNCLIPNTRLLMADPGGPADGFAAQGGIFLEPSFPRQVFDINDAGAGLQHVIDSDHSLTAGEVGHRSFNDYATGAVPVTPEGVHFYVRRFRRWHEFEAVNDFMPLRFAYEIRRGRLTAALTASDRGFQTLTASNFTMDWAATTPPSATVAVAEDVWNTGLSYTGTQLGAFDDPNVNINAGDVLRLLDDNGEVLEEATIAGVTGPGTLRLAVPGITMVVPAVGQRFEIFLRQAPVPHEQSMEQLLDLATFRTVHATNADYALEQGGYVPENTTGYANHVNQFFDDHSISGVTLASGGWSGKGVRAGDILVIDPTPSVPQAGESGEPPVGDKGVPGRNQHEAGGTDALDDNRGFYRVVRMDDSADPPALIVEPTHSFAGTALDPVVFPGTGHPNKDDINYAIYPTVTDAQWAALAEEGQNDLRPTKTRSPSASYVVGYPGLDDKWHSIRPVSYRIIRPNQMFTDETIDLILTVRERMLSWMQRLDDLFQQKRMGNYFQWMRDNHPHDLEALGVMANAFVESFMGHWNVAPYMNTNDCLSILDRRFWIQDAQLDRMEPTNVDPAVADRFRGQDTAINPPAEVYPDLNGPYTAYTTDVGGAVLPVLPGRVEEALDNSDRLRPIRYIWLAYRTHRLLGTLASITRFDAELPERLEEQRQLALLQESTDKAETE